MGPFNDSIDEDWGVVFTLIFSTSYLIFLLPWYFIFNKLTKKLIKSSLLRDTVNITAFTAIYLLYYISQHLYLLDSILPALVISYGLVLIKYLLIK